MPSLSELSNTWRMQQLCDMIFGEQLAQWNSAWCCSAKQQKINVAIHLNKLNVLCSGATKRRPQRDQPRSLFSEFAKLRFQCRFFSFQTLDVFFDLVSRLQNFIRHHWCSSNVFFNVKYFKPSTKARSSTEMAEIVLSRTNTLLF